MRPGPALRVRPARLGQRLGLSGSRVVPEAERRPVGRAGNAVEQRTGFGEPQLGPPWPQVLRLLTATSSGPLLRVRPPKGQSPSRRLWQRCPPPLHDARSWFGAGDGWARRLRRPGGRPWMASAPTAHGSWGSYRQLAGSRQGPGCRRTEAHGHCLLVAETLRDTAELRSPGWTAAIGRPWAASPCWAEGAVADVAAVCVQACCAEPSWAQTAQAGALQRRPPRLLAARGPDQARLHVQGGRGTRRAGHGHRHGCAQQQQHEPLRPTDCRPWRAGRAPGPALAAAAPPRAGHGADQHHPPA